MNKTYSIKQVSEQTGLQAYNIRYYEQEGLIKGIQRNHAGVRQFTDKDIEWITFLSKLKDMEMSITMMKQYAALREQGNSTIGARIDLLQSHKQALQVKIQQIQGHISLLDAKVETYHKMEVNLPLAIFIAVMD